MTRRGFFARCAAIAGAMLLPAAKAAGVEKQAHSILFPDGSQLHWVTYLVKLEEPEWQQGQVEMFVTKLRNGWGPI